MRQFDGRKVKKWCIIGITAIVVSAVTFSGCQKDEDGLDQISAVKALNAVPGSPQWDIGLNASLLNYNRETGQVEDFAYGDVLPYKNAWPGNRLVSVFDPDEYPDAEPLVRETVHFTPGRFYSLYVVGYDKVELLSIEDDLSAPAAGKAKIRFVHLSPDAPSLDLVIDGENTPVAEDKAFKEAGLFTAIDAGDTHTFQIRAHSSNEVLHTFEFTPKNGKIYTLWVKGLLKDEGDEAIGFDHDIIQHE